MNPCVENELRLHVMAHVQLQPALDQPLSTHISTIKLQPLQFLTNFIDTKSMHILKGKIYSA